MKCSILNKFFGSCLLAVMSMSFCYAEESLENLTEVNLACCNKRNNNSSSDHTNSCITKSINAWQNLAVYAKAGIEFIAKSGVGDGLGNIELELDLTILSISKIITGSKLDGKATGEDSIGAQLAFLHREIFAYTRAFRNGNTAVAEARLNEITAIFNNLSRLIDRQLRCRQEAKTVITRTLNTYISVLLRESRSFVNAVNPPPGGTSDFTTAYRLYNRSLVLAETIGDEIGQCVCNHKPGKHKRRCR